MPACAPSGATLSGQARSAWFKFVAPASGRVVADTRYSSYNTILSVWTGAQKLHGRGLQQCRDFGRDA